MADPIQNSTPERSWSYWLNPTHWDEAPVVQKIQKKIDDSKNAVVVSVVQIYQEHVSPYVNDNLEHQAQKFVQRTVQTFRRHEQVAKVLAPLIPGGQALLTSAQVFVRAVEHIDQTDESKIADYSPLVEIPYFSQVDPFAPDPLVCEMPDPDQEFNELFEMPFSSGEQTPDLVVTLFSDDINQEKVLKQSIGSIEIKEEIVEEVARAPISQVAVLEDTLDTIAPTVEAIPFYPEPILSGEQFVLPDVKTLLYQIVESIDPVLQVPLVEGALVLRVVDTNQQAPLVAPDSSLAHTQEIPRGVFKSVASITIGPKLPVQPHEIKREPNNKDQEVIFPFNKEQTKEVVYSFTNPDQKEDQGETDSASSSLTNQNSQLAATISDSHPSLKIQSDSLAPKDVREVNSASVLIAGGQGISSQTLASSVTYKDLNSQAKEADARLNKVHGRNNQAGADSGSQQGNHRSPDETLQVFFDSHLKPSLESEMVPTDISGDRPFIPLADIYLS